MKNHTPSAEPAAASAVVPIQSLFYDDGGPHIIEREPEAAVVAPVPTVPIDQLLYRGPEALHAALALRSAIEDNLEAGGSSDLADLLDELFDLINLGLTQDTPEV